MNALELLREWPCWKKANAETVLSSPAWRLVTDYGGETAVLEKSADDDAVPRLLELAVMLDGKEHRLTVFDNAAFADLHRLADRFADLPPEIVLALVEKECGALLQTVENVFKRQLRIKALAERAEPAAGSSGRFILRTGGGAIGFALDLDPVMVQTLGALKNLDVDHRVIREMTREVASEYAVFDLVEGEIAALGAGCRLVMPGDFTPVWRTGTSDDDLLHLRGETVPVSFAAFADDDLPPVPQAASLALFHRGTAVARGKISILGSARVFEIKEVL